MLVCHMSVMVGSPSKQHTSAAEPVHCLCLADSKLRSENLRADVKPLRGAVS